MLFIPCAGESRHTVILDRLCQCQCAEHQALAFDDLEFVIFSYPCAISKFSYIAVDFNCLEQTFDFTGTTQCPTIFDFITIDFEGIACDITECTGKFGICIEFPCRDVAQVFISNFNIGTAQNLEGIEAADCCIDLTVKVIKGDGTAFGDFGVEDALTILRDVAVLSAAAPNGVRVCQETTYCSIALEDNICLTINSAAFIGTGNDKSFGPKFNRSIDSDCDITFNSGAITIALTCDMTTIDIRSDCTAIDGQVDITFLNDIGFNIITSKDGTADNLKACGIEDLTYLPANRTKAVSKKDFHSCRHTFCYLAGKAGIPLIAVQSVVGHMTPEMTALYSSHTTQKDKQEYFSRLHDILPYPSENVSDGSEKERCGGNAALRDAAHRRIETMSPEELQKFFQVF